MVTVNINLQSMSGITGLSQLRADHPSVLLVVVAECRERDVVLASLRAGVHGYIPTSTPPDEMVRAFEAILSGNIYVPPLVSECTVTTSDDAMDRPVRRAELTDRQIEVLKLVAAGQSDKEIARSLSISATTVKVHMRALFRALGVHNRVSAAATLPTLMD